MVHATIPREFFSLSRSCAVEQASCRQTLIPPANDRSPDPVRRVGASLVSDTSRSAGPAPSLTVPSEAPTAGREAVVGTRDDRERLPSVDRPATLAAGVSEVGDWHRDAGGVVAHGRAPQVAGSVAGSGRVSSRCDPGTRAHREVLCRTGLPRGAAPGGSPRVRRRPVGRGTRRRDETGPHPSRVGDETRDGRDETVSGGVRGGRPRRRRTEAGAASRRGRGRAPG